MQSAKIFQNGQSQALRIPKEFRFEKKEVYLRKFGDLVIISPEKNQWKAFLEGLDEFAEEILPDRCQPPIENREEIR